MSNESNTKRMSMIVTKGTLDWAYPPFILATTAAAMGLDVTMFFTFYGLTLLKKKLDLKISTLGNPAMEMPMFGMHIGMPNLVSAIPGVDAAATTMMKNLKEEGRRLDRGVAQHRLGIRRQDDRLPDDHGPV
jgi:peroxiredoxin family protein